MLSAALLFFAGLGDALHMLPGMGHAGHCHGWSCHTGSGHAGGSGHFDTQCHANDGHSHHQHDASGNRESSPCCGNSAGPVATSATFEFDSGEMQAEHDCALCKFLASLKHVTPPSVAMHQWQSLCTAQIDTQSVLAKFSLALAYHGRAPPVAL
ncbi:hypothetical protein [Blastopirellula marina]|uniref:hypothetical protein n=1 Tax=Blastopirellula marina TaxID=124 RepID=UPI0011B0EB05|nr:hypothetical protein [Blastopirellula marina]